MSRIEDDTPAKKAIRENDVRRAFLRWLHTETGGVIGSYFDAYQYSSVSGLTHHRIRSIVNALHKYECVSFPQLLRDEEREEYDNPEKGDVAGAASVNYLVTLAKKGKESVETQLRREEADKQRQEREQAWKQEVEEARKLGVFDRQPDPVTGVGSDEINALIAAENRLLAWVHSEMRHKVNTDPHDGSVGIKEYALIQGCDVEDIKLIGLRLEKRGFLEARNSVRLRDWRMLQGHGSDITYRYVVTEKGRGELARLEAAERQTSRIRRRRQIIKWLCVSGITGGIAGLSQFLTNWSQISDWFSKHLGGGK